MADSTSAATVSKPERTLYQAGSGRRVAFAFIFLLLLPFYLSLPAMFLQRFVSGLWLDLIGLTVIALFFTAIMGLLLVELLASIRTSVELGDGAVRLTVPRASGPTPKMRYASYEIPYGQIKAIETRREIYGGAIAPIKLLGSRILTKDDRIVRLGFVSEADTDPALPFPEIAAKLAERSGAPLVDKGSVYRTVQQRVLGIATPPGTDAPIEDSYIEVLNKQHRKVVLALVFFLTLLIGVGLLADILIGTEG